MDIEIIILTTNYFELKNLNWLLKHLKMVLVDHSNLLWKVSTFELFARVLLMKFLLKQSTSKVPKLKTYF